MNVTQSKTNSDARAAIYKAQYISVTTYRKTGVPVLTPVWFTLIDETLYFETATHAGKVKRLHNNPRVSIAPCTAMGKLTGAALEGTAQLVDGIESQTALAALQRKYHILRTLYYSGLNLLARLRRKEPEQTVIIAIQLDSTL